MILLKNKCAEYSRPSNGSQRQLEGYPKKGFCISVKGADRFLYIQICSAGWSRTNVASLFLLLTKGCRGQNKMFIPLSICVWLICSLFLVLPCSRWVSKMVLLVCLTGLLFKIVHISVEVCAQIPVIYCICKCPVWQGGAAIRIEAKRGGEAAREASFH